MRLNCSRARPNLWWTPHKCSEVHRNPKVVTPRNPDLPFVPPPPPPHHGGDAGTGPFTPTPSSLPGFGPEVPGHGRQRRPKEILLDLVEDEKMGFHPMCLYSKYSVVLGEPNSG